MNNEQLFKSWANMMGCVEGGGSERRAGGGGQKRAGRGQGQKFALDRVKGEVQRECTRRRRKKSLRPVSMEERKKKVSLRNH